MTFIWATNDPKAPETRVTRSHLKTQTERSFCLQRCVNCWDRKTLKDELFDEKWGGLLKAPAWARDACQVLLACSLLPKSSHTAGCEGLSVRLPVSRLTAPMHTVGIRYLIFSTFDTDYSFRCVTANNKSTLKYSLYQIFSRTYIFLSLTLYFSSPCVKIVYEHDAHYFISREAKTLFFSLIMLL